MWVAIQCTPQHTVTTCTTILNKTGKQLTLNINNKCNLNITTYQWTYNKILTPWPMTQNKPSGTVHVHSKYSSYKPLKFHFITHRSLTTGIYMKMPTQSQIPLRTWQMKNPILGPNMPKPSAISQSNINNILSLKAVTISSPPVKSLLIYSNNLHKTLFII